MNPEAITAALTRAWVRYYHASSAMSREFRRAQEQIDFYRAHASAEQRQEALNRATKIVDVPELSACWR